MTALLPTIALAPIFLWTTASGAGFQVGNVAIGFVLLAALVDLIRFAGRLARLPTLGYKLKLRDTVLIASLPEEFFLRLPRVHIDELRVTCAWSDHASDLENLVVAFLESRNAS